MVGFVPLNPSLYTSLRRHCGDVNIVRQGIANTEKGYTRYRRRRDGTIAHDLEFSHIGETYSVRCPFCHGDDKSLSVNYTYGVDDGTSGRRFLAHCFRRYQCLNDPDNREAFYTMLQLPVELGLRDVRRGKALTESDLKPWWPECCEPIHKLSDGHPARLYLLDRGFDPQTLYDLYRIHYCTQSFYSIAKRRIIIPIFAGERFVGWQGRIPEELPWKDPVLKKGLPPKYTNMTGFRKSLYCYNLDVAQDYQTIVVVEGVTGVWRHGAYATAIAGMKPSSMQLQRLARAAEKKSTIVWLLDPGTKEQQKAQEASTELRRLGVSSCCVELPDGFDSGELDASVQQRVIEQQADLQGFSVCWDLKSTIGGPRVQAAAV